MTPDDRERLRAAYAICREIAARIEAEEREEEPIEDERKEEAQETQHAA